MKYCVNSLAALPAANLISPCSSSGTCARLGRVPCLAHGDHVDCLSTGSCFGWKTCRLRKVWFCRVVYCCDTGVTLLLRALRAGGFVDALVAPAALEWLQ